jgi:D-alanyl-D-alanine carboxypeptidase
MTALVFLDNNPGWDKNYTMQDADRRDGGKIYLYRGDEVTVRDLFDAMLVGSDNTATIALIHAAGFTEDDFVKKMNDKAATMGLTQTKFFDAVGLNNDNVSTAREVAELAKTALATPEILQTVSNKSVTFKTTAGIVKIIDSTDSLLNGFSSDHIQIIGGKTGHTDLAGYCFVAKFTDQNNHVIISVVLGTDSEAERFRQTAKLANWIYDSFTW